MAIYQDVQKCKQCPDDVRKRSRTYNATERFSYYILGVFLFLMVMYGSTETYVEVKASSTALAKMLSLGIIESRDADNCKHVYFVAVMSYAEELILEIILFIGFCYLFF